MRGRAGWTGGLAAAAVTAATLLAGTPVSASGLCSDVDALLEAKRQNFRTIRADRDDRADFVLGNATRCSVLHDADGGSYSCTWSYRGVPGDRPMQDYEALIRGLYACTSIHPAAVLVGEPPPRSPPYRSREEILDQRMEAAWWFFRERSRYSIAREEFYDAVEFREMESYMRSEQLYVILNYEERGDSFSIHLHSVNY
ncbi:hypothetical protein J2T57_001432 [Natronocella acetinitrilica]|uniref:Uncharacterized protein n=1 Tax=Natronocella acetinitrilica TaxID=414046 RepID=A0AAE3KAH7_9GAMM|nr:hypothetical protein [Natronocella acetinitrilica]MCP1674330.1 hypothetical protein [Natronocella acetinitrilica]